MDIFVMYIASSFSIWNPKYTARTLKKPPVTINDDFFALTKVQAWCRAHRSLGPQHRFRDQENKVVRYWLEAGLKHNFISMDKMRYAGCACGATMASRDLIIYLDKKINKIVKDKCISFFFLIFWNPMHQKVYAYMIYVPPSFSAILILI